MPLKPIPTGSWGVGSAVAVAHVVALATLARLDGPVAPPVPLAIQVTFAVPDDPASDPGPAPEEGPSPLPQAARLPPSPEPVRAPDPVVAVAVATTADAPTTPEILPRGEPSPVPSERADPVSSQVGGGGSGGDAQGDGEIAESSDYLTNPAPSYPMASRLLGEEGRVLVRVLVDTSGTSRSVALHESSGHPRLDGSALSTIWSWKFHPAKRGGKPVEAWVIVPIRFSLKGA